MPHISKAHMLCIPIQIYFIYSYIGIQKIVVVETLFLTILEARNLESRCYQGHVFSKTLGENLFHVFLLAFGSPAIRGALWFEAALTPASASVFPSVCVSSHKDISHIRLGPTLNTSSYSVIFAKS